MSLSCPVRSRSSAVHLVPPSFPTRRSSDLVGGTLDAGIIIAEGLREGERVITTAGAFLRAGETVKVAPPPADRKSTRLNSSHLGISYAVFCLKKKKSKRRRRQLWMRYR